MSAWRTPRRLGEARETMDWCSSAARRIHGVVHRLLLAWVRLPARHPTECPLREQTAARAGSAIRHGLHALWPERFRVRVVLAPFAVRVPRARFARET